MFYLAKYPSKAKLVIVKKIFLLLAFIAGMAMYGQVVVDTLYYNPNPEFHFVSDDGNGTYTISGHDYSNNDGLLVVYKENVTPHLDVKNFPPDMNHGSVHEPYPLLSYTINDTTYAAGVVANSIHYTWGVIRMYLPNQSNYSLEKKIRNCGITPLVCNGNLYMILNVDFNQYSDLMNSGWNITQPGQYFVKLNKQDLSIIWMYQINDDITNSHNSFIIRYDYLIGSTSPVYRYAVQALPNGNIAVTVGNGNTNSYELWEFDPNTGQKIGVIDDSYTDYDRDGVAEMQYRFHRWKVVDGVLFHEFWNDPNNSQDQNVGHWEKLEVPGWASGNGNANVSWDPSQLQVTAVSNWGNNDSFRTPVIDFYVDNDGMIHWYGRSMTEKFALYKNEVDHSGALNGLDVRDEWVSESGETMMMTPHSLVRVTYGEQFINHIEAVVGNNVVEARNGQVYHNGWHQRAGEATIVVEHSAMPQVGDTPDASWWSIPSGFHFEGVLPIKMETRPGDEDYGKLYFDVGALEDNQPSTPSELILRVWVVDANTVGIPEMEIAGLKLYPNPVESFLTVEADMDVDAVRIYNMSGIAVKEVSDGMRVYMGNLPAGVYIVEVTAGDKVSRRKVIKK